MEISDNNAEEKRTRMRGDERRALILAIAKQLFAQQSYHEVSTSKLAQACGITEPILYKHFGSKQKLFQAVLVLIADQFLERFRDLVKRRVENDLSDGLASLVLDYRAAAMQDRDSIHLLMNAMLKLDDPEVFQLMQIHNREMYEFIYDLLAEAQKQNLISADLDLPAAAWGFVSFLFALQYRVKANLVHQFNEPIIREINRLWLRALQNP